MDYVGLLLLVPLTQIINIYFLNYKSFYAPSCAKMIDRDIRNLVNTSLKIKPGTVGISSIDFTNLVNFG